MGGCPGSCPVPPGAALALRGHSLTCLARNLPSSLLLFSFLCATSCSAPARWSRRASMSPRHSPRRHCRRELWGLSWRGRGAFPFGSSDTPRHVGDKKRRAARAGQASVSGKTSPSSAVEGKGEASLPQPRGRWKTTCPSMHHSPVSLSGHWEDRALHTGICSFPRGSPGAGAVLLTASGAGASFTLSLPCDLGCYCSFSVQSSVLPAAKAPQCPLNY